MNACLSPTPHTNVLPRRLFAEFRTGLLVTVVVGSGIAAQRLSPADVGLQLLENSTATALGLTALILMVGVDFGRTQPGRLARRLDSRSPLRHWSVRASPRRLHARAMRLAPSLAPSWPT